MVHKLNNRTFSWCLSCLCEVSHSALHIMQCPVERSDIRNPQPSAGEPFLTFMPKKGELMLGSQRQKRNGSALFTLVLIPRDEKLTSEKLDVTLAYTLGLYCPSLNVILTSLNVCVFFFSSLYIFTLDDSLKYFKLFLVIFLIFKILYCQCTYYDNSM